MDDLRHRLERTLGDAVALERELGGGGMARVFLGTERALDRRIVVKVLDLEGAVAAGAERFRREIKVVAQLQHPHIVPVFTAGGDETLLWYAMPYVTGESLRARLTREGALPVADAVRIAREVLDALGAAHGRGIVHRDIKPENILLEGAHAQVADFGVAKALSEAGISTTLTAAGLALGTPAYMAPEQAMADPTTNHRADLYSVGAVLFEMLVGAPPYAGNAQAIVAAHLTAPVPQLSDRRRDVPPVVAGLTTRLLAKNPAERPQSAAEAIASLESISTPSSTSPRSRRRVRAPLVAAGLATVALAAAGLWAVARPATPDFADGTEVIAVMPLGSTGDSTLARLGRDLVVTLSANIDGVGTIRTVDAMSVLQRAGALPQPLGLDAARSLGVSLGATYIVHGSIISERDRVRVDAALYGVDGSEPLARFSTPAPRDGGRELTDSLSAQLFRQVWKRGTPPSPMLAEVATASGEALRAFLEGEAAFERFDVPAALDAYDRATLLDSNFVQAWLRKAHVRSAAVLGADSVTARRLEALVDRMPARDRALRFSFSAEVTFGDRLAAVERVAARYPEYHMAQYRASDMIIHFGPLHSVPITRALPYLDRLDSLAPRHADNAQHRMMVAFVLGDTVAIRASATRFAELAPSTTRWERSISLQMEQYQQTGQFVNAATATAALRSSMEAMSIIPIVAELSFLVSPVVTAPVQFDSALTAVANDPAMRSLERQYILGVGTFQFSRGDVPAALKTFARLEGMNVPNDYRTARIRSAATAAWLGLMPLGEAEAAAAQSRRALAAAPPATRLDMLWSDAVLAIAAQDSARFLAAVREVSDTSRLRGMIARGLHALWRERSTGNADSLIATDDDMMPMNATFLSSAALTRLAIGRALTLAGDPGRAEHYLQWTDAVPAQRRSLQIIRAMTPYNSYERGIAAEAAGDRNSAILHLKRFVDHVDRPPASLASQVEDAKARLARLVSRGG